MELTHLIALRMKELRYRYNFTQQEMAELIGVSLQHYQTIEAGRKSQMWMNTGEKLARAFCLELWQLISPELPSQTKPRFDVVKSCAHYQRRRKGPYQRRKMREVSQ